MQTFGCYQFVFSSSATIYKPNKETKYCESDPREPINPYGKTKLAIENILEALFDSNYQKWKIVNLRYFNL